MAEQQFQSERVHMNSGDQSTTMVNASMSLKIHICTYGLVKPKCSDSQQPIS